MQLEDIVTNKMNNFSGSHKLSASPSNIKYAFVGDYDRIRISELDEVDAWFSGIGAKLLNIYTAESTFGFYSEPIYNRGKQSLYWSIASREGNIKRTHSSFIHDMIYTMASKVGVPSISSLDADTNLRLQKMIEQCNFGDLVNQIIIPVTCSEGTTVIKPCYDKRISNIIFPQIYNSHDVRIINNGNMTMGVLFLNYYNDSKGDDYVLVESRYRAFDDDRNDFVSVIEYSLFRMTDKNELEEVSLDSIEETKRLPKEPMIILGYNSPLCIVNKFYQSIDYPNYGESIITPKIDLADDLDQALSQQSTTTRRSTPQEYVNSEYVQRENGKEIPFQSFDRNYNMLDYPINGDGKVTNSQAVFTTQPELNIDQYGQEIENIKAEICGHFISPSTMGIGMSKKDNGDAQREKEKITTSTRNHIINVLTKNIVEYFNMALCFDDLVNDSSSFDMNKKYDISVSFDELNAPTTEGKVNTFTPMFTSGAISEELFVDKVWGNSLSEEQKNKEIQFLKENKANLKPYAKNEKDSEAKPNKDKAEGIKGDNLSYSDRSPHSTKEKPE